VIGPDGRIKTVLSKGGEMEQFITNFVQPILQKYGGFIFIFIWTIALIPILTILFMAMTARARERNRINSLKKIKKEN
jgi:hypothetical protein